MTELAEPRSLGTCSVMRKDETWQVVGTLRRCLATSYWEMAASLVNSHAIDWKMFMEANPGEPVNVFVKLYPHLKELRSMFASKYDDAQAFQHLERCRNEIPTLKSC